MLTLTFFKCISILSLQLQEFVFKMRFLLMIKQKQALQLPLSTYFFRFIIWIKESSLNVFNKTVLSRSQKKKQTKKDVGNVNS